MQHPDVTVLSLDDFSFVGRIFYVIQGYKSQTEVYAPQKEISVSQACIIA